MGGKFDGESHYVQNFTGKGSAPSQIVQMKTNIDLGQGKFNGQSTYTRNYVGSSFEVPQMIIKKITSQLKMVNLKEILHMDKIMLEQEECQHKKLNQETI